RGCGVRVGEGRRSRPPLASAEQLPENCPQGAVLRLPTLGQSSRLTRSVDTSLATCNPRVCRYFGGQIWPGVIPEDESGTQPEKRPQGMSRRRGRRRPRCVRSEEHTSEL